MAYGFYGTLSGGAFSFGRLDARWTIGVGLDREQILGAFNLTGRQERLALASRSCATLKACESFSLRITSAALPVKAAYIEYMTKVGVGYIIAAPGLASARLDAMRANSSASAASAWAISSSAQSSHFW